MHEYVSIIKNQAGFLQEHIESVLQVAGTEKKHHTLRSLLAFAAIQSTYKGPYTPGSALCLVYTFAQSGEGGLMRRVKGGMGALSEVLAKTLQAAGGEIRHIDLRAAGAVEPKLARHLVASRTQNPGAE